MELNDILDQLREQPDGIESSGQTEHSGIGIKPPITPDRKRRRPGTSSESEERRQSRSNRMTKYWAEQRRKIPREPCPMPERRKPMSDERREFKSEQMKQFLLGQRKKNAVSAVSEASCPRTEGGSPTEV